MESLDGAERLQNALSSEIAATFYNDQTKL